MSMIISARPLTLWIVGALAALGLWLAALIAVTVAAEPTRAVIVFARDHTTMMTAVASVDVALLDGTEGMLTVAGRSPGFVARLYAAGAWLVLPSRASGCVTPPPAATARSQARD